MVENERFSHRDYWEERYTEDTETYDWLGDYTAFRTLFERIDKRSRMLIVGCGNSLLGPQLTEHGFTSIVNLDYAPSVIETMATKFPGQCWVVGDARSIDGTYSVIVDKATLDVFFTQRRDVDPWNISQETLDQVSAYLDGIARTLEPDGTFLHITWAQPHFRVPILSQHFHVRTERIEIGLGYFAYWCRSPGDL